jgi:phage terminase large subunit
MTAEAQFDATTWVFGQNYQDRTHRVKINQGGTSSGKTYSILQVIAMRLIEQKRIATVVGQDIPNLKKGAYRDFSERILPSAPWLQSFISTHNKSTLSYTFTNGSILEFASFGDEQDAKNGKRDIAFFNEGNGIPYTIYRQVAMRTAEEIFVDYNPTAPFWAHDHLIGQPGVVTFYSNYTHNPYISEGALIELRSLKDKDAEMWKVYGLGKTGEVGELCIENMAIVERMPDNLKRVGFGMDFGYRADPTTLVRGGL